MSSNVVDLLYTIKINKTINCLNISYHARYTWFATFLWTLGMFALVLALLFTRRANLTTGYRAATIKLNDKFKIVRTKTCCT